jgi:chorismate mutase/prephenate dehydratase
MQHDLDALSDGESAPDAAAPSDDLPALRASLDSLDDAIHDLLMQRAEVVSRVATVKTGAALRPGREASILRRLLARSHGPLPRAAVVRIWREMLAASTAQQKSFSAAVCEPAMDGRFAAATREHFGALAPLKVYRNASQAIGEVVEGRASIAVLPLPGDGGGEGNAGPGWWPGLLQQQKAGRIHVIARLPFWQPRPEGAPQVQALVVATNPADPSGNDVSLIALEAAAEVSRGSLSAALTSAGFKANVMLLHRPERSPSAQILVEVAGYVPADDPRLAAIRGLQRPALLVGAYALPVSEAAA